MQDDSTATARQSDPLDPGRANAMQAALGLKARFRAGDPLPPFYHHLYFWDAQPPEALGRDGHPRVGTGVIPDMGLPRRMWAGGRLEFHAPLRAGRPATRETRVDAAKRKQGRSGSLAFVTLRHDIVQNDQTRVTEWQDLVYREDPAPGPTAPQPSKAPTGENASREIGFDTTLLFRYSALTFNGHRIHYDVEYAREVENYAGLVVHGPLLAQLLMLFATEHLGALSAFSFRATSPMMHTETATLCWLDNGQMWVRGPDGRQCMTATATGR